MPPIVDIECVKLREQFAKSCFETLLQFSLFSPNNILTGEDLLDHTTAGKANYPNYLNVFQIISMSICLIISNYLNVLLGLVHLCRPFIVPLFPF